MLPPFFLMKYILSALSLLTFHTTLHFLHFTEICSVITNFLPYLIFFSLSQVPVSSWFDDMSDSELMDLVPFLETLSKVDNVYSVLRNCNNPLNSQTPPQQQQGSQVLTQISQGPMTQVQPSPPPLITQQHQQEQQQQQYQKDYEEGKDGPS